MDRREAEPKRRRVAAPVNEHNYSAKQAGHALARGLILAVTLHAFEQIAVVAILEDVVLALDGRDFSGVIFGVYLLASILATVFAGEHIDRRGPAVSFGAGLALFAAGLIFAGTAQSIEIFIAARALQGAGGGLLLTVAYATVNVAYNENERPGVLAALSMAWVLPGLLGPPIAAALAEYTIWKWRSVFVLLAPLVPVVAVLALPAMRAIPPTANSATAGPGFGSSRMSLAALLCAGVALLQVGGVQARSILFALFTISGAVLTLTAMSRLMPSGTLRLRPVLPAAIALKILAFFAFFGTDSFIPFALQEVRDVSLLYAALTIAPASLSWSAAAAIVARFQPARTDYARTVRWGCVLLAAGIALAVPVLQSGVPTALTFLAWTCAGFGIGLAYISLNAVVMNQPKEAEGVGAGRTAVALNIADSLGFALGSTVTGSILFHGARAGASAADQFTFAWLLNFGVALFSAFAASRLIARHQKRGQRDDSVPA